MPEESTTPDLVALARAWAAAEDVETTMSFYGSHPVWDGSAMGLETFEGREAIRENLEDWLDSFDDFKDEDQEVRDLGQGVVLSVSRLSGRLRSAEETDRVHGVYAYVSVWTDGKISRVTAYADIDKARAAAERLAEERG
jgi:ketosteroid isomerase-like protein